MTEQHTPSAQSATSIAGAGPSHAAAGPLTIRDVWVLVSVLIIFIASLVPIVSTIAGSFNLWNTGGLFYIGIGVLLPLAVGGLFLARRLSPESKVRFGSLSIDQFASVVAAFATFFFFTGTVTNFGVSYLVGLIGSLLLLAGTACAQWIPMLASDFVGRAEIPAHVAARDAVPALKRPSATKPADAAGARLGQGGTQQGAQAGTGQGTQGTGNQGASGVQGAGGWAGAQASSHASAGRIFTPAKETSQSQSGAAQSTAAKPAAAAGSSTGADQPAAFSTGTGTGTGAGATSSAAAQSVAAAVPVASAATKSAASTPAGTESASTAKSAAKQDPAKTPDANKPAVESTPAGAATGSGPRQSGSQQSGTKQGTSNQSGTKQGSAAATTLNPQVAGATKESIGATVNPRSTAAPISVEPFWFAVDRPQNVIDEKTRKFLFKLVPGTWILALEDRGNSFIVQDSHGKTGVLLDLVGIERASDSQ
ncbi:hypothetical protein [Arthrobacter sp. E3]|uniref:hypothetical protein n=1 Tax=Arthrobacter sp. E3 TaxID=517402 RepID=UPI001A93E3A7|nr:hypothetical protein [Arthrobacter sp. E3]